MRTRPMERFPIERARSWRSLRLVSLLEQIRRFFSELSNPRPLRTYEPTQEQKEEITEAIRKQRFRGDLAGRLEYNDD